MATRIGLERILLPAGDIEIVEFEKPIDRVVELHSPIETTVKTMIVDNSSPVSNRKVESQNDVTQTTCT